MDLTLVLACGVQALGKLERQVEEIYGTSARHIQLGYTRRER